MTDDAVGPDAAGPTDPKTLELIVRALRGLRFGEVVITIQDGVVVQLERTERTRVKRAGRRPRDV